jgi:hypothetical protein
MPLDKPTTFLASLVRPAESCERSRLSPGLRIAITFAVLFALKLGLPSTGLAPALQVLALLAVATFFAWRFWWNCSPDRRGVALLVVSLWTAGLLKIVAQRA